MMQDYWLFGLLTQAGQVVTIKNITVISDDGRWIDVELAEQDDIINIPKDYPAHFIFAVGPERTQASIQIASIVPAVDLMNS